MKQTWEDGQSELWVSPCKLLRQLVVRHRVEVWQRWGRGQDTICSQDLQFVCVTEELGFQDLLVSHRHTIRILYLIHDKSVYSNVIVRCVRVSKKRKAKFWPVTAAWPPHRCSWKNQLPWTESGSAAPQCQIGNPCKTPAAFETQFAGSRWTNKPTKICSSWSWECVVPVVKDIGDGPKATGSHATRAGVAAVHSPKHEIALLWIQLQQQHHSLTTQLVNLEDTTQQLWEPWIHSFQQSTT